MNRHFLVKVYNNLLHLLFPQLCCYCHGELLSSETALCFSCIQQLPTTNFATYHNNDAYQHFIGRVPVIKATAFTFFTKAGMMQELLHQVKYHEQKDLGILLGKIFAEELVVQNWLAGIDYIMPVPLHKQKLNKRGYNQSSIIAKGIVALSNIPLIDNVLIRTKNTDSQTRKNRRERIDNVTNVFKLKEATTIANKHLLLIDDVLTTGATIEACANALLKAPGVKISVATIAIATD